MAEDKVMCYVKEKNEKELSQMQEVLLRQLLLHLLHQVWSEDVQLPEVQRDLQLLVLPIVLPIALELIVNWMNYWSKKIIFVNFNLLIMIFCISQVFGKRK